MILAQEVTSWPDAVVYLGVLATVVFVVYILARCKKDDDSR
jgi:hypothetical protein